VKPQNGAERIVHALKHANVRCVFGLPGTQILELFEALRKAELRTVTATNELAAAFMAGGWARATGEPGVLLTMAGPGFMWSLNGVAEARLDSVPLLHITGNVGEAPVGRRFRQQELPQAAIAAPLTKAVIEADNYPDPGVATLDALRIARDGDPGPVLLQVSNTTFRRDFSGRLPDIARASRTDQAGVDSVLQRLKKARRPIFLIGRRAERCGPQIRELIERLKAPLLTTPSARGILSEAHPFNFGFDPYSGSVRYINELIESSDLVLAIGCKLGHSTTFGFELALPSDRLVHVNPGPDSIGANYSPSLEVIAESDELFAALLGAKLPTSAWSSDELTSWRVRVRERAADPREPRITGTSNADASSFFHALRSAIPANAMLVLDSGLHQMLARRYYEVHAATGLLMPTDLQSMGFAIPTAIGAKLAKPDRKVIALLGDGGFAMTALELLTAVRERLALVVIVFVDGAFGQIRMQQRADYGASHGVAIENPDFRLLAQAVGVRYEFAGESDIESVVGEALDHAGVTVIEVTVGDTLKILGSAVAARLREETRRVAGPGVSRRMKAWLRRAR
jgi:acetolactate synthase I/II/III large subunit